MSRVEPQATNEMRSASKDEEQISSIYYRFYNMVASNMAFRLPAFSSRLDGCGFCSVYYRGFIQPKASSFRTHNKVSLVLLLCAHVFVGMPEGKYRCCVKGFKSEIAD